MGNVYAVVRNAVVDPYPTNVKTYFGTREFTMKHYSVIPIIMLMVADVIFATSMSIYMYNTRDIAIDRNKKPINERMDLLEPYLLKVSQQLRAAGDIVLSQQ